MARRYDQRHKPQPGSVAHRWQPSIDSATPLQVLKGRVLAHVRAVPAEDVKPGAKEISRALNADVEAVYRALSLLVGERLVERIPYLRRGGGGRYASRVRYQSTDIAKAGG